MGERLCFPHKVAAAANEGQVVCEAFAAGVPLTFDWCLQGILHCAVVPVCVGIECFGIYGYRSRYNGYRIIVMI